MKTTTYIIAGLAICGAVASGVVGALGARITKEMPRLTFTTDQITLTCPTAPVIVMNENRYPSENIYVNNCSDFTIFIEESDSVSAPQLTMSETWAGLITTELKDNTLFITADFHSLTEFYSSVGEKECAWIYLDPTDITLTLPRGMAQSITTNIYGGRPKLNRIEADSLGIFSYESFTVTDSRFNHLIIGTPNTETRFTRYVELKNVKCQSTTIDISYHDFNLYGSAHLGNLTLNADHHKGRSEEPSISIGNSMEYNDIKLTGNVDSQILIPLRSGQLLEKVN